MSLKLSFSDEVKGETQVCGQLNLAVSMSVTYSADEGVKASLELYPDTLCCFRSVFSVKSTLQH